MEKNKKLLKIVFTIFTIFFSFQIAFSQNITEEDARKKSDNYYETELKKLAEKITKEQKGTNINGVVLKGCYAEGKKLIWQYEVPSNWYPLENGKNAIIENFRKGGSSDLYYKNGISVEFQYFTNDKFRHKFQIDSKEFANEELGDFISIKGHPKSLGIDMQLKIPDSWKSEEGDRPHIVKKFTYMTNGYMSNTFLIEIQDNVAFVSRNEAREMFSDEKSVNDLINQWSLSFFNNHKLLNHRLVTIDKYPTLEFTVSGTKERAGLLMNIKFRCWYIFYEDKIVNLMAMSLDNGEFERMEPSFYKIVNSIIFPEQYNR